MYRLTLRCLPWNEVVEVTTVQLYEGDSEKVCVREMERVVRWCVCEGDGESSEEVCVRQ